MINFTVQKNLLCPVFIKIQTYRLTPYYLYIIIYKYYTGTNKFISKEKRSCKKSLFKTKKTPIKITKGVVARNAFKLKFSELLIFPFLMVWTTFQFLPCSFNNIKKWKSYSCDIYNGYSWLIFTKQHIDYFCDILLFGIYCRVGNPSNFWTWFGFECLQKSAQKWNRSIRGFRILFFLTDSRSSDLGF